MPVIEAYKDLKQAFAENRSNRDVLKILTPRLLEVANGEAGDDVGRLQWHNGLGFFTYVPLKRDEIASDRIHSVAIHIWPNKSQLVAEQSKLCETSTTSTIHGHSFNFESRLVTEECYLEQWPIGVTIVPESWESAILDEREHIFGVFNAISRPDGTDILERQRLVAAVRPGEIQRIEPGQTYSMSRIEMGLEGYNVSHDAFHISESGTGDCVTIMLPENDPSKPNLSLGACALNTRAEDLEFTETHSQQRILYGRNETVEAVGRLVTLLGV
ncbi:MAG TPA: hypothetical protein VIM53_02090 [Candidatus Saccharimonadales bacterium]